MVSISSKQFSFAGFTIKHPIVKLRILIVAFFLLILLYFFGSVLFFLPALVFVARFGDVGWLLAFLVVGGVLGYVSYRGYKQTLNYHLQNSERISPDSSPEMAGIYDFVQRESEKRGMNPPDIYVFHASDLNATTIGRKQNSYIFLYEPAFTTWDADELEAIVGHELAHITNHDVVLMTAIHGFYTIIFDMLTWLGYAARLGYYQRRGVALTPSEKKVVKNTIRRRNKYLLAPIVWCKNSISRNREYIADANSAEMTSSEQIQSALATTHEYKQQNEPDRHNVPSSLSLIGNSNDGILALFRRDHPALPKRISRIQKVYNK